MWPWFNTLRPRQYGSSFPGDTLERIFLNENVIILIKISLKFVAIAPNNNIPALVQIMAWRRPGDKPLTEPMMLRLPTHICVSRPQWVNKALVCLGKNGIECIIDHKAVHVRSAGGWSCVLRYMEIIGIIALRELSFFPVIEFSVHHWAGSAKKRLPLVWLHCWVFYLHLLLIGCLALVRVMSCWW